MTCRFCCPTRYGLGKVRRRGWMAIFGLRWERCPTCLGVPPSAARSEHIHARWGGLLARPGMDDAARGPEEST